MKKIVKASLLLAAAASLGVMNVNAKTMTANDIEELSKIEFGGVTSYENVYIYGKNVHINLITMSDIILSGNDMEGVKDKSLYYKNGDNVWTKNDGLKENTVNKSSVPTFEMTKLIGQLNGGHVSEETGIYDGDYVKTEDYTNNRKAEIFVDETAPLSIVDIKPVQKAADLSSVIGTDTNKYNSSAVSINYNDNAVTITENSPLLSFHYNNSSASEKWVALLVKTNKTVTKDDIKNGNVVITLGGTPIDESRIDSAANHGGASNEFVIWAKASDFSSSNKEITFKEKVDKEYTDPQKITVTYTSKTELFIDTFNVTENDSNDVEILTEGVEVAKAVINGQHKNIFYTSKSNVTRVDFLVNGDKKYAASTDWKVKHLLQVRNVNVAKAIETSSTSANVWNQNSVSVNLIEHKSTSTEQYDYIVEISHNKQLKSYKTGKSVGLNIDFSVDDLSVVSNTNATIDKNTTNRTKAGITNSYEHLVWVNGETIVTFKNSDPADNTITIKFVLVDETPELNVDIKKGTATDIFPDTKVPNEASANTAYKNNIEATSELELTYDESAKQYLAVIRELKANTLKDLKFDLNGKGITEGAKNYIGVIVDLGVDPAQVTVNGKAIAKADIEKAKNHGASSETAFIYWINETITEPVTFKYLETEETVKVKFEIRELKAQLVKDNDQTVTKVVVADEYKNDVTYNESEKGFVITSNTTKFVATTTTKNGEEISTYEYTYNVNDTTATKVRNLKLNNAYKVETKVEDLTGNSYTKYNTNSVSDVNLIGNTVNVTFNKHINATNSTYCILLDLGVNVSNNYIYIKNDNSYGTSHLKNGKANLISDTTQVSTDVQNNLVVLCANHSETSTDKENETYTINLVNSNAESSASDINTSIPYEIVIKSHVEADPYLDMENAEATDVVLDVNNGLTKEEIGSFLNMEGLTTELKDDKVYIHYTKEMKAYDSNADKDTSLEKKSYFAILFDLGVDPSKLTTKNTEGYRGYGIADDDIDSASVKKFGGSGTQFILWLDKESFELDNTTGLLTYKITFVPNEKADDKYSDPIVVTFILVDDVDRLSIEAENLSERAKDEEPFGYAYDVDQYNINQDRLDYEFISEDDAKSIVVSKVKDADAPVSYDLFSSNYNGQWYAIEINLNRNISVSSLDGHNLDLEMIDSTKGKFILWVNCSGDLEENNTVTITDLDSRTSETLTIKVSK